MLAIILGLLGILSESKVYTNQDSRLLSDSARLLVKREYAIEASDSTARYFHINRIFIIGNRITHDDIILRELTLKTGDVIYSIDLPEILDKDRKKLLNTRLFNTVEIRTLELQDGMVDLLIDLNERWYTFPSPIFELADRNFNEWWQNYDHDFRRVNYGLRLYQYNMRGRNETLRFTAQFGFQRVFNLSYRMPYIDHQKKHGLVLDLDFQETKNLAFRTFDHKLEFAKSDVLLRTTRGVALSYTYRNSFYAIHSVRVEYRSSEINDTVLYLNPNYYRGEQLTQRYGTITYQFTHDHRDLIAYPLSGHYLIVNAMKTGLSSMDDVSKIEGSVSYGRYIDLKKGYYFSNYSYGYWSSPTDIPYSNYAALGYRKQFPRGYEIYVIEGPYMLLNKLTLKKLIFSNTYRWEAWPIEQFRHIPIAIYLKTYADVGYVRNYPGYDLNTRLSNRMLAGAGAGIDVVGSYDMVLRFEYSFNHAGENGFFFHLKKEF